MVLAGGRSSTSSGFSGTSKTELDTVNLYQAFDEIPWKKSLPNMLQPR